MSEHCLKVSSNGRWSANSSVRNCTFISDVFSNCKTLETYLSVLVSYIASQRLQSNCCFLCRILVNVFILSVKEYNKDYVQNNGKVIKMLGYYCFLDPATRHSLWLQVVSKFNTWTKCCKARLYSFKGISNLWRRGTSDAEERSRYTSGQMDRTKQPILSAGGLAWRGVGMFALWGDDGVSF